MAKVPSKNEMIDLANSVPNLKTFWHPMAVDPTRAPQKPFSPWISAESVIAVAMSPSEA